jgi:uncharacterized protein (DUF849 family)
MVNPHTIITCALTGDGDTRSKNSAVPVTPEEIARDAIDAAQAGAAIVHIHVRDPKTTHGSRETRFYREAVERIRASGSDVIINLTAGMGGKLLLAEGGILPAQEGSDLVGPLERMRHIEALRPEICSLDCGSFNSGSDDELYVSTIGCIRTMAKRIREVKVKPELECFDLGHVTIASQLVQDGLVPAPALFQFALGIRGGAPANADVMRLMRDMLPPGSVWAAFGIGASQLPMVAQSVLLGGNVRVGLEDNLYLKRGVLASNPELVEQAAKIVVALGSQIATPAIARQNLGLGTVAG